MLLLYYAAANTMLANHPKGPLGYPKPHPWPLGVDRPPPRVKIKIFYFFDLAFGVGHQSAHPCPKMWWPATLFFIIIYVCFLFLIILFSIYF
jgi:hypothetical protein